MRGLTKAWKGSTGYDKLPKPGEDVLLDYIKPRRRAEQSGATLGQLDLKIDNGKVLVVSGPTGSGKSTNSKFYCRVSKA